MRSVRMFFVVFLLAGALVSLGGVSVFAAGPTVVEARVVGSTFKTMAKAYVAASNLGDLRAKGVHRIKIMREDHYRKRYAQVYAVLSELPLKLLLKYGVTRDLTKAGAVTVIGSLEKKDLYEIIDAVPDAVIAREFRKTFEDDSSREGKLSVAERVKQTWADITGKIEQFRTTSAASGK